MARTGLKYVVKFRLFIILSLKELVELQVAFDLQSSFMTAHLVYDPLWTGAIAVSCRNYYKLYKFYANLVISLLLQSSHKMLIVVSNLYEILKRYYLYRKDILSRKHHFNLHILNI